MVRLERFGINRTRGDARLPAEPVDPIPHYPELLGQIERLGVGSFWATDAEDRLVYLSNSVAELLAVSGEDVLGRPITAIFYDTDLEPEVGCQRSLTFRMRARSSFEGHIAEGGASDNVGGRAEGTRLLRISGRPYFDEAGVFNGYRGEARDITDEYREQQKVARQSQYDELTGLANRRRIGHQLESKLRAYRAMGRSCALMMLDLDRFKQVNDTLGHPAGDELLKLVSVRLLAVVKQRGEVGRLGGDEFQIILPDLDDRGELSELAARIIQAVSQPYTINGRRAVIGTSIGMAIAPYDGIDVAELNRAVDLALYSAKEAGRGAFRFYNSEMSASASRGAVIQEDLRDALVRGELSLNYQPLVNPHDNTVRAFEALMRWNHPESGFISPAIFIPIAEQTELINAMGEWALRQACSDAVEWAGQLRVAVNVSAKQFSNPNFPSLVAAALANSGLPANRLELEITESVFVGEMESIDGTFRELVRLGVRLAMDDFGTGYSSLGYLKRAPFSKIKIDQSFVRGCTAQGDTNPAIISAIVALAKALDMETVAEGVEAMDELALVRDRGADLVQGYVYSRPLPQEEVLRQLASGQLVIEPDGPPRHRADRISVFRKIGLIHEDHYYDVMLRNLSKTGARVDGLAGVPVDEEVVLDLGGGQLVVGTVVHSKNGSIGLKFETNLITDGYKGFMTKHRVSPYALAEAGLPFTALRPGGHPLAALMNASGKPPRFVQLELAPAGSRPQTAFWGK